MSNLKITLSAPGSGRPSRAQLLQQAMGSSSALETRRLLNSVKYGSEAPDQSIEVDVSDEILEGWVGRTLTIKSTYASPTSIKIDATMTSKTVGDVLNSIFPF